MGRPRSMKRGRGKAWAELRREAALRRAAKKYVDASKELERLQANVKGWDDRGNIEINDMIEGRARWLDIA